MFDFIISRVMIIAEVRLVPDDKTAISFLTLFVDFISGRILVLCWKVRQVYVMIMKRVVVFVFAAVWFGFLPAPAQSGRVSILAKNLGNGRLQIGYDAAGEKGKPAGINLEVTIKNDGYIASETDILSTDPNFPVFIDYIYENVTDYQLGEGFPLGDPCGPGLPLMPARKFVLVFGNLDTHVIPDKLENLVTLQLYHDAGSPSPVEIKANELRGGVVTCYWQGDIPVIEYADVPEKKITVSFGESLPEERPFVIDKCLVKAEPNRDPTREVYRDSIMIFGSAFVVDEATVLGSESIHIELKNSHNESVLQESFLLESDGGKPVFAYKKGRFILKSKTSAVKMLMIDIERHSLLLLANNIDLTGLDSPMTATVTIGDVTGVGQAYDDSEGEAGDVVNGARPMPAQLLMNYADSLTVSVVKFKPNHKTGLDSLVVMGELTAAGAGETDLTGQDVSLTFGSYTAVIPADDMQRLDNRHVYLYNLPRGESGPVALAQFDFDRGAFRIIIKNAPIGEQGCTVNFGLKFGGFDETRVVDVCP